MKKLLTLILLLFTLNAYSQSKTLNLTLLIEGFYNPVSNVMVSDTVSVFIFHPEIFTIDSAKGILDNEGNGLFTFNNVNNLTIYLFFVQHRNSIETWSNFIFFKHDTVSYDFTTAQGKAYASNQVLKGNKYCIYSGDVNQDGIIDASDLSNVDNDLFNSVKGYIATDVNGDNVTDAGDLSIVENNLGEIRRRPFSKVLK